MIVDITLQATAIWVIIGVLVLPAAVLIKPAGTSARSEFARYIKDVAALFNTWWWLAWTAGGFALAANAALAIGNRDEPWAALGAFGSWPVAGVAYAVARQTVYAIDRKMTNLQAQR